MVKTTIKFTKIGIVGSSDGYSSSDSKAVRFSVEEVSSGNVILIEAKILGASSWKEIGQIVGANIGAFDIYTYDQFRIRCTTYDAVGNDAKIVISTTDKIGSGLSKYIVGSDSVLSSEVTFKSTDSSVTITANLADNSIDFKSTGSSATEFKSDPITLNITQITNKQLTLSATPTYPTRTILSVVGGSDQFYGQDFTVSGNILSWAGLGLDGELTVGDKIVINFA